MSEVKSRIQVFFLYLGVFLVVPIVGTLLHEVGHYLAAVLQGYEASISYAFCSSTISPSLNPNEYFIFILGGPLATWTQSLIPFVLLLVIYRKDKRNSFENTGPPLYIVLLGFASFAGRFIFNAGGYILQGSPYMDEVKMADYLGLPESLFVYLFGGIGLAVLFGLVYALPKKKRFLITLSCLIGSVAGYLLWYEVLGPIVLPPG